MSWTIDKTKEEIQAAIDAGRPIFAIYDYGLYGLAQIGDTTPSTDSGLTFEIFSNFNPDDNSMAIAPLTISWTDGEPDVTADDGDTWAPIISNDG